MHGATQCTYEMSEQSRTNQKSRNVLVRDRIRRERSRERREGVSRDREERDRHLEDDEGEGVVVAGAALDVDALDASEGPHLVLDHALRHGAFRPESAHPHHLQQKSVRDEQGARTRTRGCKRVGTLVARPIEYSICNVRPPKILPSSAFLAFRESFFARKQQEVDAVGM